MPAAKTLGLIAIYTRGLLGNADSSRFLQDHQEKQQVYALGRARARPNCVSSPRGILFVRKCRAGEFQFRVRFENAKLK